MKYLASPKTTLSELLGAVYEHVWLPLLMVRPSVEIVWVIIIFKKDICRQKMSTLVLEVQTHSFVFNSAPLFCLFGPFGLFLGLGKAKKLHWDLFVGFGSTNLPFYFLFGPIWDL